jgi:hypothetical protein
MIYQASMQTKGRKAKLWLVGRRHDGGLTRYQEFEAWTKLLKLTRCQDSYQFATFRVMNARGALETSHAGNCF